MITADHYARKTLATMHEVDYYVLYLSCGGGGKISEDETPKQQRNRQAKARSKALTLLKHRFPNDYQDLFYQGIAKGMPKSYRDAQAKGMR